MENHHHIVSSAAHFKDLMSKDLNRVSVINFWAPWAKPSIQMNQIVEELVKKHPAVQFLQVHAEEQEEISESFDVESVPTFVILRGHTILSRVSGADAAALTTAVTAHDRVKTVIEPRSTTSKVKVPEPARETPEELEARLRRLMNQSKVVLFMKGSPGTPRCGFSKKTCALLKEQNVEFTHFDILRDEDVRQGLKKLNNWPTFPQLIVNGELVGGLDILQDLVQSGDFADILSAGK